MEAYIFVMSFSSSPNSLLDEVGTFLFTMMNKWIEHKDNNLIKYYNGGPRQVYRGPTVDANYIC